MLFVVTKPLLSPMIYAVAALSKMLCLRLSPRKKQDISNAEVSQTRLMPTSPGWFFLRGPTGEPHL